jgi:hypothetical protein
MVSVWDYIEPVMVGALCVGWTVNWTAYHAACDRRDQRAALRVVAAQEKL